MDRRKFLQAGLLGLGAAAVPGFGYLFDRSRSGLILPGSPRAKSVVLLYMVGGPSQIELFDYKEALEKLDGKRIKGFQNNEEVTEGAILKPIEKLQQYGQSSAWVSTLLPKTAEIVDELTFLKSVNCSINNHAFAQLEFNTGNPVPGDPFAGAWINSALQRNPTRLPGMVVMLDELGTLGTGLDAWSSGNLPKGESKLIMSSVEELRSDLTQFRYNDPNRIKGLVEGFRKMNAESPAQFQVEQRQATLELFLSMHNELLQSTDLADVSSEEEALYGLRDKKCRALGEQLILSRRLVEKGVPFVQVYCGIEADGPHSWDHHIQIQEIRSMAHKMDQPIAGFIKDLKRRGLLDSTVVIWGGEFGRLPVLDTAINPKTKIPKSGRGHNERANTIWLAGAGLKKGISFGETDDLSMRTVRDRVEMGDVWATVLHLLGINHQALSRTENGKVKRLTRPYHRVIHEILS